MRYLIDGYNLLHAMGVLHGRVGPAGLERARRRLLGLLGRAVANPPDVTVVFDAAGAPPGATEEEDVQGVRVLYAVRQDEADDLVELLIRQDSAPRQLTVVSDDHRLQHAARRRHCAALGCLDYLDELDRRRRGPPPPGPPEKAGPAGGDETRLWLREFAGLEQDPDWKELTDPFGFGDGGAT
jgi:predicted RNA-binding protein with PIN domain